MRLVWLPLRLLGRLVAVCFLLLCHACSLWIRPASVPTQAHASQLQPACLPVTSSYQLTSMPRLFAACPLQDVAG